MVDRNYERGDIVKVRIPSDWNPSNSVAFRSKLVQNKNIPYFIILKQKSNEIYLAIPCDTRSTPEAIPVNISGERYYAHIESLQIHKDILYRETNADLLEKENILHTIDAKLCEKAERKRQAYEQKKARRKERKKSEPTIQEVLYNWPTKAIAEERRRQESLTKSPQIVPSTDKNKPPIIINKSPKQTSNHTSPTLKYLKRYECVTLSGLNRNAFKHRITLTNYTCDNCLECSNRLIKFVNFLQISEMEGIRAPGQYCTKCDLFYEDHGTTLRGLVDDGIIFGNYTLNADYLIPDYSQKIRLAHSIKSASLAIHLNCKDSQENRLVTIVSDRSDRNHQHDIFHYSDWFARQLLYSVYKEHKTINIAGDTFSVLKVIRLDWKNKSFLNQIKIDTIVLRTGGGLYGGIYQRNTELVDILLYSPYTDCFEVAHATYDAENEIYFMDAKVFRGFVEKYGNPGVKIAAYQIGARDFSSMKEESILHAYGYVVGATNGIPERMRRELLSEVMDLGIMSAESILRLLDHNISMHPQDKYIYARRDWETDKEFVLAYKVNPNRFVIATIGL